MKAFIELKLKDGIKTIQKISSDNKALRNWLIDMLYDNEKVRFGYIDNGTYAVIRYSEDLWPEGVK
mgnify:FL=1